MAAHMEKGEALAALISSLEGNLSLPVGFLDALRAEDDWSFVIKGHALLEAAVTHLLVISTDPRLGAPFAQLELSGVRAGKLAFASALELLGENERRFVRRFSELRNSLVHDVRNVTFTFESHVASLDKNQTAAFYQFCTYFVSANLDVEQRESWQAKAIQDAKHVLWWGLLTFIFRVYKRDLESRVTSTQRHLHREKAKLLDLLRLANKNADVQ